VIKLGRVAQGMRSNARYKTIAGCNRLCVSRMAQGAEAVYSMPSVCSAVHLEKGSVGIFGEARGTGNPLLYTGDRTPTAGISYLRAKRKPR